MIATRNGTHLVWLCDRCNADASSIYVAVRDVNAATHTPYPGSKRRSVFGSSSFGQPKAEWQAACDVHTPERRHLMGIIPVANLETVGMVTSKGRSMTKFDWMAHTNWQAVVTAAMEAADA